MVAPIMQATSLAEVNEFANAQYAGAQLPEGRIVPAQWCTSAQMRGYVISELAKAGYVATHETALWIHTAHATVALSRALHFASSTARIRAGVDRVRIPAQYVTRLGTQLTTTPARTCVDLLAQDIASGIEYLLITLRTCPDCQLADVRACAQEMSAPPGIGTVRRVLAQLPNDFGAGHVTTSAADTKVELLRH